MPSDLIAIFEALFVRRLHNLSTAETLEPRCARATTRLQVCVNLVAPSLFRFEAGTGLKKAVLRRSLHTRYLVPTHRATWRKVSFYSGQASQVGVIADGLLMVDCYDPDQCRHSLTEPGSRRIVAVDNVQF